MFYVSKARQKEVVVKLCERSESYFGHTKKIENFQSPIFYVLTDVNPKVMSVNRKTFLRG